MAALQLTGHPVYLTAKGKYTVLSIGNFSEKEAARRDCPVERFKLMLSERGFLAGDDYLGMVSAARARISAAESAAALHPLLDAGGDLVEKFPSYVEGARN